MRVQTEPTVGSAPLSNQTFFATVVRPIALVGESPMPGIVQLVAVFLAAVLSGIYVALKLLNE